LEEYINWEFIYISKDIAKVFIKDFYKKNDIKTQWSNRLSINILRRIYYLKNMDYCEKSYKRMFKLLIN